MHRQFAPPWKILLEQPAFCVPRSAKRMLCLQSVPMGPHQSPAASRPLEGERLALTTHRDVEQTPSTTPDKLQEEI